MGFYSGFEKRAAGLAELRKAYDATVKPYLIKRIHRKADGPAYINSIDSNLPKITSILKSRMKTPHTGFEERDKIKDMFKDLNRAGMGKIWAGGPQQGIVSSAFRKELTQRRKKLLKRKKKLSAVEKKPQIVKVRGKTKGLLKAQSKLTGKDKEGINRIVSLHEGIERAVSRNKKRLGGRYSGHTNPEVLLRESNIVATLPKELKGAKSSFRTMRGVSREVKDLKKMFPGFEYGKQRISRHARKRMMERAFEKGRTKKSLQERVLSGVDSALSSVSKGMGALGKKYRGWQKLESDIARR